MKFYFAATLAFVAMSAALPAPTPARAQVAITITAVLPPPALPDYDQPPCPAMGYIWAPGYWAWDGDDYYWVAGAWVRPPAVGLLWTPVYWTWRDGLYVYNAGYWGPHVGFYGGIVYGFGYTGSGYEGGYWHNGAFFYNRTVNNVTNINIINVYDKTVIINSNAAKVGYNGGKGGVTAAPTPEQLAAAREMHHQATASQLIQQQAAHKNPQAFARMNNGKPPATLLVAPQHLIPKTNAPAMLQAQKSHQQLQIQSPKPMVSALKPRPQPKMVTQQTRRVVLGRTSRHARLDQPGRPAAPHRPPRHPRCPHKGVCR